MAGLADLAPSHNIVAKVAYAPTIQTTVVTTTTTTTTSFPPFVMPAPRNLFERDPEVYPLAATPTPEALRKIQFQINGQTAQFEEADNPQEALQEVREDRDTKLYFGIVKMALIHNLHS